MKTHKKVYAYSPQDIGYRLNEILSSHSLEGLTKIEILRSDDFTQNEFVIILERN